MGQIWRSEEMEKIQLFIQIEAAHASLDELGNLGIVQFIDMNSEVNAFHRNFVNEVRRTEELLRRIRFLEELVQKADINVVSLVSTPGNSMSARLLEDPQPPLKLDTIKSVDELDGQLEELEREFRNLVSNRETLHRNHLELYELEQVLLHLDTFFDDSLNQETETLNNNDTQRGLSFISGVISRDKMVNFERVLWRTTRGNIFLKKSETPVLTDPTTGLSESKYVFAIFVQGQTLRTKINKVCESFGAHLHLCSENTQERKNEQQRVKTRITDIEQVIDRTEKMFMSQLTDTAMNIEEWKEYVIKEKSIYHMMNMMNYDLGRKCLIGEGWCPKDAMDQVHQALARATQKSGAGVPSIVSVLKPTESPPTYFKTNAFTLAFQNIVDSYGVARYREVNPTVFALITFPFLFGVMFGDVGHGIIMTITAYVMIKYEEILNKLQLNEMVDMAFKGRYLIFLMGLFSIYAGLLYNECFSVPIDWWGTNWKYENDTSENAYQIDPDWVYPFAVDPGWKGAKNELDFYNSLKMKLSVIFGVSQMVLGIVLSAFNAVHFNKPYNLYFEFLPQLTFMLSLFGYMCVLIVIKWLTDWSSSSHTPPYLLTTMIDIFLSPTSVSEDDRVYDATLQNLIQLGLIAIAFISVPMMLFPKPYLLKRDHLQSTAAHNSSHSRSHHNDEHDHDHDHQHEEHERQSLISQDVPQHSEEEEFDFGEVMVHQIIHTIEFVLGCISNTASYLRLWALSLAHAQLSTVFWEMVLVLGVQQDMFGLGAFVCFAIWATLTICVLMIMESLSAFLHALRLHWVEFMNKFYGGDGKLFIPFSYKRILAGQDEELQ